MSEGDWQLLGQVFPPSSRNPGGLWSGSHPKILEWVRKEISRRSQEIKHWGDSIRIVGSYWEYLVRLQEGISRAGATHADDGILVYRRRIKK